MRLLIAALGLVTAACSPVAGPVPGSGPATPTAEQACLARGGTLQPVGRLQSIQCVVAYADAGKRCTDGDDCAGDCLTREAASPLPGSAAVGQCAAISNRFGCATRVEDGKADATLCID